MLKSKGTNFLSEINAFFKNNDASKAMNSMMDMISGLNMSERTLFDRSTRFNSKYSLLQILTSLILFPCFMIRNPYNCPQTRLGSMIGCGKDVFYRFVQDARINWRKLLYRLSLQLWTRIRVRSDHKNCTTCLIVDDTDFGKTGKRFELMGRVFSHIEHKSIIGFKSLTLAITDGISQMVLDFALLGEPGKKGNFSMTGKELAGRYSKTRPEDTAVQERINEYSQSKIKLTIDMIRRAIRKGVRFRYILADSWFACADIIRFATSRHIGCDYLGMIKVGEKGRTKYRFERNDLTAPALVKLLKGRKQVRYSRKLKCYYAVADVVFADTKVRLFFIRRGRQGAWNGLITTDLKLEFFEAYRIYAQRWSLEVVFKDSKSLLGLGKCQARDFASQIACASLAAIQYNLLSVVKRFNAYETIGALFRETCSGAMELTIVERIWGAVMEMVIAVTSVFNITDEEIYDAVINKSEELAHICEIYRLKMAV